MSAVAPEDEGVHRRVVEVIQAASDEGCPVVGHEPEQQVRMASLAIRRWRSQERRIDILNPDLRIRDLAKGLAAGSGDRALVGPLIEDYRYLSAKIAAVLSCDEVARSSSGNLTR